MYRFFPKVAINDSTVEYVKVMDGARCSVRGDNYNTYNLIKLLYLPEETTYFSAYVFRNIKIEKLYMNIKNPLTLPVGYGDNINSCSEIYVPIGSASLYHSATNWNSYSRDYIEYDFDTDPDNIRPHL